LYERKIKQAELDLGEYYDKIDKSDSPRLALQHKSKQEIQLEQRKKEERKMDRPFLEAKINFNYHAKVF